MFNIYSDPASVPEIPDEKLYIFMGMIGPGFLQSVTDDFGDYTVRFVFRRDPEMAVSALTLRLDDGEYAILLNANLIEALYVYAGNTLANFDVQSTIVHELQHLKQALRGDYDHREDGLYWKGERIPVKETTAELSAVEYLNTPIEREAHDAAFDFLIKHGAIMSREKYDEYLSYALKVGSGEMSHQDVREEVSAFINQYGLEYSFKLPLPE